MFLAHHCLTFRWRWWRWDCSWSGWALFAKSGGWLRQHATAVCSYDTGFDRSPNRGTWMVIKKIECMLPADCLLTLTLNLAEPIFVAVDSLKMKWCLHPSCWIWGALLKPSKTGPKPFEIQIITFVCLRSTSWIQKALPTYTCIKSKVSAGGFFYWRFNYPPKSLFHGFVKVMLCKFSFQKRVWFVSQKWCTVERSVLKNWDCQTWNSCILLRKHQCIH